GAGIGAAVAVNQIGGTTTAQIIGDTTSVNANADDSTNQLSISDGLAADTYGSTVATSGDFLNMKANNASVGIGKKRNTKKVTGVAVNASATHTTESGVGNVAGALFAGIAGTANVNTLEGNTNAAITGAKINQTAITPSNVTVKAEDYAMNFGFAGSVAAGIGGVGGATDTNKFTRSVSASVTGKDKATDSLKAHDLDVVAKSIQGASSFANGVGVGGFGVGGTASVGLYEGTTEAYVKNSKVNVSSIEINADHQSKLFIQDGGAGIGGVGIGAAVGVSLDANTTKAYMENSTVATNGAVDVIATNTSKIMNVTVSGAFGATAAVGSSVSVNVLGNTADAHIVGSDIGSSAKRAGDVTVKATNTVDVDNITGSAVIGGYVSGGASVAVNRIDNTTSAYIGDSNVYAASAAIEATADRAVDTTSIMGSVTGGIGLNGNVSVTTIGSELNNQAQAQSNSTLAEAYGVANSNKIGATQDDGNGGQKESDVSKLMGSVGQKDKVATLNAKTREDISTKQKSMQSKTYAGIISNSTVDVTQSVLVSAKEKDAVNLKAGTVTVGLVSVGAAVDVLTVHHNVESIIDSSAITATDITTKALAEGSNTNLALQGSVGGANINATVAVTDLTSNTTAKVTGTLTASGNITVSSEDTTSASATAQGYQLGLANVGAVVASAVKDGESLAAIGSGSIVNMNDNAAGILKVEANRSGEVTATARAGTGGIISGNASDSTAKDSSKATAETEDGVTINANNDTVQVQATAMPKVQAESTGISIALGAQVGVSIAQATAAHHVDAHIGTSNTINAANLDVKAQAQQQGTDATSSAKAEASGGALLLGANATSSLAESNAVVNSYVGDNSTLTVTGITNVYANSNTKQK
ncbi:MAG: hypothetical protein PHY48_17660, partial [Candidatus Cloacimonetes bacterium]|nr:hypothetical protein [Candidatus Cloacimonadota bacterium]